MKWPFVTLLLVTQLASGASAAVYTVYADGSGSYPTIQAALNAAGSEDVIELGNGVFTGTGNRDLDFGDFSGVLRAAGGDPLLCTLELAGDPFGSTTVFNLTLEFEGINFRHGAGFDMTLGALAWRHCRFEACTEAMDLHYYLDFGGNAVFTNCEFRGCDTTGLISAAGLRLERCLFTGNTGPLVSAQVLDLVDSDFIGNQGDLALVESWGADTYFGEGRLMGCRFIDNDAETCYLASFNMTIALTDCSFVANTGTVLSTYNCALTLANCTFAGNRGGGDDLAVFNYGDWYPRGLDIQNCIFAFRAEGAVLNLLYETPPIAVACSDMVGNVSGDWTGALAPFFGTDGNISANPQFCNWAAGDVTLFNTSPCLPENNSCGVQIGAEGQGCTHPTAAEPAPGGGLRLSAAPNPFNPKTRLAFSLPEAARVDLAVFDASGRRVATLLDNTERPAGEQTLDWNAAGIASGVYLARLEAGSLSQQIKLVVLR